MISTPYPLLSPPVLVLLCPLLLLARLRFPLPLLDVHLGLEGGPLDGRPTGEVHLLHHVQRAHLGVQLVLHAGEGRIGRGGRVGGESGAVELGGGGDGGVGQTVRAVIKGQ